ncbi:hypothetical protein AAFF_G00230340 [Aldrovandia affinis]|uniref:Uncharacterized protein n=1 Tax=Aldrovandia affinis TaxID=143900 RepID=A0AAD7WUM2_9TELE|nr:hypothetical protein AAFF_G00230340 [Aldrovandia affinis]
MTGNDPRRQWKNRLHRGDNQTGRCGTPPALPSLLVDAGCLNSSGQEMQDASYGETSVGQLGSGALLHSSAANTGVSANIPQRRESTQRSTQHPLT